MLVQVNQVTKNFGGEALFEKLDLVIHPGEKIGLIGMNGTGKSTLLKIILGEEGINAGVISYQKGLKIGYIQQSHPQISETVLTYILQSFTEILAVKEQLAYLEEKMAQADSDFEKVLQRYGLLQEQFEKLRGYTIEDEIVSMLKGLGLAEKINEPVNNLSGGQRVRVELAKTLVAEGELLLLDEPTNHLDLAGIQWLENYLRYSKKAFVIISHDRQFLDNVVKKVTEIDDGTLYHYPGNYSRYAELKKIQIEKMQKDYELQQKEILRLKNLIRQFRQWGNESDNEKFYKKAKMYEKQLEKIQRLKKPMAPQNKVRRKISEASRSGSEVLIAENLGKIVGEKLLFADSSFKLYRQERVALMGENGSGKSTLIKIINDEETLDEGQLKLGAAVKIGYLPQKLVFEEINQTLLQYAENLLGNQQKSREELARFGFYAGDVSKRLKDLSGGEKVRLYLLKLFQTKINFLILDEPTNHLDIYAREEIEEILQEFTGTLLVVSHDRYFLQKSCQQALMIENQTINVLAELPVT
ncbi:ATP-binding cassette subfamily F protein 3 [Enterococcus sp. PF1-24]|uniref:ribosomal protection-like ABC-F family protein n=1 Tax=unclassified Enterococcus TaxID=2608891 RepID=UPI002472EF93|nr:MULTISPECIES: ABC-F family ATP-binding cassette domain-containing protein [unclassified Enterococcus]MDH6363233.1 ATP-binding cassette subfamily F protein 3 [Enterococcus sp. PFB1-1]MDH6400466.1 ATP-binding cassette subfamily F protein 3 [Enterococcus sp. PF1-24]